MRSKGVSPQQCSDQSKQPRFPSMISRARLHWFFMQLMLSRSYRTSTFWNTDLSLTFFVCSCSYMILAREAARSHNSIATGAHVPSRVTEKTAIKTGGKNCCCSHDWCQSSTSQVLFSGAPVDAQCSPFQIDAHVGTNLSIRVLSTRALLVPLLVPLELNFR